MVSNRIPPRFHYNMFHAIYFMENDFQYGMDLKPLSSDKKKSSGQQSLMKYGFVKKEASVNLTAEQLR